MDTFIDISELKIGMYVKLRRDVIKDTNMEKEFFITDPGQLRQINNLPLPHERICIDPSKKWLPSPAETMSHAMEESMAHEKPEEKDAREKQSREELTNAVKSAAADPSMPPDKKAEIVYDSARDLMQALFESPTAEFIKESKDAVGSVVDMVLEDEDTAINMIKVSKHDFYTYTHSVNVGTLSICLAKRLFQSDTNSHDMRELGAGFFLHDLGKVRVAESIINKPGRLDDHEMKRMRTNPYQSFKILRETSQLSEECRIIAMQHHERDDGTGYPLRLKGHEIHDYGRICCIADVYDALTAKRSYKEGMTPFQALKIMREEMLHHFQKEIFHNFVLLFKE